MGEILKAAPKVKILVTSRQRLNLAGEWRLELHGLEFPKGTSINGVENQGAVQLFVQNVRRTDEFFALTAKVKPPIVRICQLVEGMPLGIELASGLVGMYSCEEIVAEIEKNLDVLKTSQPGVPTRHRSMVAVFDYFWQQFSQAEKNVLKKLSVFRGGFRGQAAQHIAGASPFFLSALIDKSFLRKTLSGRYEIHEVLRQYAEEKLVRSPQAQKRTRDQHCSYYVEYLHARETALKGAEQKETLNQIEEEIENVRMGWDWLVKQQKIEAMGHVFESLYAFYNTRGWFQEGETSFRIMAQQLEPLGGDLYGKMLARQAIFQAHLGNHAEAKAVLEQCLVLFKQLGLQNDIAFCLNSLASAAEALGEFRNAAQYYEEALVIYRAIGSRRGEANVLNGLGGVTDEMGEMTLAAQYHEESIAIYRAIHDQHGLAQALNNLATVVEKFGELDRARKLYDESLALLKEIDDHNGIAGAFNNLGNIASSLGDYHLAEQYYSDGHEEYKGIGNQRGVALTLSNLGNAAYFLKQYERSEQLQQQSLEIRRRIGDRYGIVICLITLGSIAHELEKYGQSQAFRQQALAVSREIGFQVGVISGLGGLGEIASVKGEYGDSKRYFAEAIKVSATMNAVPLTVSLVVGIATPLAEEGAIEQAIRLLAQALHHPATDHANKEKTERLLAELQTELSPEIFNTAFEHGKGQTLEELVAEILKDAGL